MRTAEIAIKLALVVSCGRTEIDSKTMQWCADYSYWSSQAMIDIVRNNIYDSQHHKEYVAIRDYIVDQGNMVSHTAVSKKFNAKFTKIKVHQYLESIEDAGEIKTVNSDGEPRAGNQARYYLGV